MGTPGGSARISADWKLASRTTTRRCAASAGLTDPAPSQRIVTRDPGLSGSWTLGRIAAELRFQLHQIGEDVGLTPQLVGDHRRLARNGRDHGHADAAALHGLPQPAG